MKPIDDPIGKKFEIVGNHNCHGYKIGDIVEAIDIFDYGKNDKGIRCRPTGYCVKWRDAKEVK